MRIQALRRLPDAHRSLLHRLRAAQMLRMRVRVPEGQVARAGWVLITTGVFLGGILGAWFWFRWLPVPAALADPFSRGRWALIAIHVCLIVFGLALVGLSAVVERA